MSYNYCSMPLYPPINPSGCCAQDHCMRFPLFNGESGPHRCGCTQSVRLENPCQPGEYAEVLLSVDHCGNLVVCLRREPPCNYPHRRRRHC